MRGILRNAAHRQSDDSLRRTILSCIEVLGRDHVLSTNKVIERVRQELPDCVLSSAELAKLIGEIAKDAGLVPVFDPYQDPESDQFRDTKPD